MREPDLLVLASGLSRWTGLPVLPGLPTMKDLFGELCLEENHHRTVG